jgi:hypothetical protein
MIDMTAAKAAMSLVNLVNPDIAISQHSFELPSIPKAASGSHPLYMDRLLGQQFDLDQSHGRASALLPQAEADLAPSLPIYRPVALPVRLHLLGRQYQVLGNNADHTDTWAVNIRDKKERDG